MAYDRAMWTMGFAPVEELSELVAKPEQVRETLKDTVLLFSDQVPFWVKVVSSRQLYGKNELRKAGSKAVASEACMSQVLKCDLDEGVINSESAAQTRAQGVSEQDRYRVTFECVQEVHNYFESKTPEGKIGKSLLVLIGGHGRLSNISDEGNFLEDEHFTHKGKEIVRKAGQSARGLLKSWVELRRSSAEVRTMLESIEVMQQPSGFADSVIVQWHLEAQSKRYPQAIHQKDLFAAALCEASKKASWLAHQVLTWIAGKMTSCLQLTDTDLAFPLKAAASRSKDRVKREMRDQASMEGQSASFRCGPYEVLRISYEAHVHMVELNAKENTVLRALRRNGMLSYRPSLTQNKMVRTDEQDWASGEDMKEGSHRIPKCWFEDRYSWCEEGIPQKPQWERCGDDIKGPQDMEDPTAHGEEGAKVELACWKDDEVLKDGVEEPAIMIEVDEDGLESLDAMSLQRSVKVARRLAEVDKLMTSQVKQPTDGLKHQKRAQIRSAVRRVKAEWRTDQRELLSKYSRAQLLQALCPGEVLPTKGRLMNAKASKAEFAASGVHGWPLEFCGPWNVSFICYHCLRVFVEPVIASGGLLGLPP